MEFSSESLSENLETWTYMLVRGVPMARKSSDSRISTKRRTWVAGREEGRRRKRDGCEIDGFNFFLRLSVVRDAREILTGSLQRPSPRIPPGGFESARITPVYYRSVLRCMRFASVVAIPFRRDRFTFEEYIWEESHLSPASRHRKWASWRYVPMRCPTSHKT